MNLKEKFRLLREISVFYVYLREGFVEVRVVVCWEYVRVFFIKGEVDFFFFFLEGVFLGLYRISLMFGVIFIIIFGIFLL